MRVPTTFGERKKVLTNTDGKRKYFITFEGNTENLYFQGINTHKEFLGINSLIELIPLMRTYDKIGWGHPKKILECLIPYLHQLETQQFELDILAAKVISFLLDEKLITNDNQTKRLHNIKLAAFYKKTYEESILSDLALLAEQTVNFLKSENIISENDAEQLREYIASEPSYVEDFDKVCILVDRDRHSFSEEQYDEVCQICTTEKFDLYITNPNFEFWLLLHYESACELISLDDLLKNNKTDGKCFTENELLKVLPSYSKNCLDFFELKDNVEKAMELAKKYATKLPDIKDTVGTNIHILLEELKAD